MTRSRSLFSLTLGAALLGAVGVGVNPSVAAEATAGCEFIRSEAKFGPAPNSLQTKLDNALSSVVSGGGNGGLGNEMWGTVVDRDGTVCAIARSGNAGDQWPGSRVISAQKANTANAFSLPAGVGFGAPLSTGNLYGTVMEAGSLLGLQFSNPVNTAVAYDGDSSDWGTATDPMVGDRIGGVNVFGGGLALYAGNGPNVGTLLGAIGVSGDTSCADHVIAWKARHSLNLDNVPGGVGDLGTTDNLNINDPPTPNTFEHPSCLNTGTTVSDLSTLFPIGPNP